MHFSVVRVVEFDEEGLPVHEEWGLKNNYNGAICGGLTSREEAQDLLDIPGLALEWFVDELDRQTY